jgi:competence protein ComEA
MARLSIVALTIFVLLITTAPVTSQRSAKPAPAATAASTQIVNLNSASATEIATLPGIGPKTADLIVQYRQKNGSFKKIEEIMNVKGIGEKTFLKLKDRITVAAEPKK